MGLLEQAVGRKVVPRTKALDISDNVDLSKVVGWHSVGGSNSYGYYQKNQYENGYSSISKLANGFSLIEPYTLDKQGKKVPSNILDRIYTPNNQMSAYDFREALAVMALVHDKVRLRVHHRTDNITADTITGFTFMEDYGTTIIEGKYQYRLENGEVLTDEEVITLKSINPDDLNQGFSPSRAAQRWTTLDDFIADYQRGFFENGAVPAGQMIITAKTATEFNDIVDKIEEKNKGAGKNNNVTYTHRPTNQNGEPLNSQIEWVPFSTQNKDMALKDLFENANKKIDSVYGVPAEIRGFLSNSNYASVGVAEKVFVKYALAPLCLKIWSKFNHELNRITGGTGVAISYYLEVPKIADEEKVKAEARQVDATTVSTLVTEGFELDSAIEYVKDGDLESLVKIQDTIEDDPEVLSADEAKDTPDQPIDAYSISNKQVSVREMPTLYESLEVDQAMVNDPSLRGCIMVKTDSLQILSLVDGAESDLANDVAMDRSPVPGETTPHVTLLYGLLNNGNVWKSAVDEVLTGWSINDVTIEEVGFFTLPDSYAIVAHIKKTTELVDGHDRIGLLPNAETFSDYKPHMTLAYIKKEADLGKWIKALGEAYDGKVLNARGIDYGDLPESSKRINDGLKVKQLGPVDAIMYEERMGKVIKAHMTRQVEKAISQLSEAIKAKAYGDNTQEEDKQFTEDMLKTLTPLLTIYGNRTLSLGILLTLQGGLSTENIKQFKLTDEQIADYKNYLARVGTGYAEQTAEDIRGILSNGILNGLTQKEIEDELRSVILGSANEYRVTRLARSEVVLSEGRGSLYSMQNIADQTGYKIYKVWNNGGPMPCEFCKALDGSRVEVGESFVGLNHDVTGIHGGTYDNNFIAANTAHLHPNDECYLTFEVEQA